MRPATEEMLAIWPRLRAHAREHCLRHENEAEKVGVEQVANILFAGFLYCGAITVAGVVHQHVDRAKSRFGLLHRFGDLAALPDVEFQRQRSFWMSRRDVCDVSGIARGNSCLPTAGEHGKRQFPTEAGGTASDLSLIHI